jgi:hypothetical protein
VKIRLASSVVALSTLGILTAASAAAQPSPEPPPFIPPGYGYPPVQLLAPGVLGRPYGYATFWNPVPPGGISGLFDAAGVGIATNADPGQTGVGMPGSRLGSAPNRIGPYGPAPGVRTSDSAAGGVSVGATGSPTNLEDPYGRPPITPPQGNESVVPVPELGP